MSFFFTKFPKTTYKQPGSSKETVVTNILSAFFLRKIQALKSTIFQKYIVRDDDSIESLADKLYSDTRDYWVNLLVNDIIDPYTEWSMTHSVMQKFVERKYIHGIQFKKADGTTHTLPSSEGVGGLHHFFNVQTGRVCDDVEDGYYRSIWLIDPTQVGMNIIPVTNFEYEWQKNLDRRSIFVVAPNRVARFKDDFTNMLRGK
jgi:hypothetical protein